MSVVVNKFIGVSKDTLKKNPKTEPSVEAQFQKYLSSDGIEPIFLLGDALKVLREIPSESIDCVVTSPPYWGKREYAGGGIGLEKDSKSFVSSLAEICEEIKRVLKDTGSFWLNIGDTYNNKNLAGIPWRVAFELTDNRGWILRNSVIWNKIKGGMDNSSDRLANVHENVFHFVKKSKGYFYDADSVRSTPGSAKIVNGLVVSATGVSGVGYRRQIELSNDLNDAEKKAAFAALNALLNEVKEGKLSDFRMMIRGVQRITHSNSERLSGRAKEMRDKGFYFLKYHPKGSKPGDVWDILPEDTTRGRGSHTAAFPQDLCKIPILTTCPVDGIVLDPFAGTGTTMFVAKQLQRKSIGIDISSEYITFARQRCSDMIC